MSDHADREGEIRISDLSPGSVLSLAHGPKSHPTTTEIEGLITGQLNRERALEVIAAIKSEPVYRAIFDDVSAFLRESAAILETPSLDALEVRLLDGAPR